MSKIEFHECPCGPLYECLGELEHTHTHSMSMHGMYILSLSCQDRLVYPPFSLYIFSLKKKLSFSKKKKEKKDIHACL